MSLFYLMYSGRGRARLADDLCDPSRGEGDPFALEPRVILERVIAMGMTPKIDRRLSGPWLAPGVPHRVEDQGNTYLVTIGRNAETILVQEERADGAPSPR